MSATFEKAFRTVFERSTNPMAVLDGERRVVEANPAAAALLGDGLTGVALDAVITAPPVDERRDDWADLQRDGFVAGRRTLRSADGAGTVVVDFCVIAGTPEPDRHLALLYPHEHQVRDRDAGARLPLTPRELEVVHGLALGESGADIARRLVLSPATVRTHVQNAMEKLEARTRAHLIAIALREHLID